MKTQSWLCRIALLFSALSLCLLCFFHGVLFAEPAPGAVKYFVAIDGNDANPGTLDKPFATLECARDAVRATATRRGATVWLRRGTYERRRTFELNEKDGGEPDAPVSYRAYEDEEVRISGGRRLAPSLATPVLNEAVLNRIIDETARPHVMQIDLKAAGIADYGAMRPRGFRRPYSPAPMELFINDEAMRLARWPRRGHPSPTQASS